MKLSRNSQDIDLQTTHIAGKIEALGSSTYTWRVGNSVEYAHIKFSLHNSDLKMMGKVVVGNLLDSYLEAGLEGNFYFVEFDDQMYLVGLKIQSLQMFDQELFQNVSPVRNQKYQLLFKNNDSIFTLLKYLSIAKNIFTISSLGFIIFPPIMIVSFSMLVLINICFNEMLERIIKNNQKIEDEFERSKNLSWQEMKRIME